MRFVVGENALPLIWEVIPKAHYLCSPFMIELFFEWKSTGGGIAETCLGEEALCAIWTH